MRQELFRIDFIHRIANELRDAAPGRTALMKLAYFAQVLKGVPLGYRFTLYSYGPFDSSVLGDLDIAQATRAVEVNIIYYSGGYGYQIKANPEWRESGELAKYKAQISQIVTRFGRLKPSDLELLSTLIYLDRHAHDRRQELLLERLVESAQSIKPRFSKKEIEERAHELLNERLLIASKKHSQPVHDERPNNP
jgi:uncharacterized protein